MKRFSTILAALLLAATASAQNQTLPNDPAVKTGKLDNGLTYYIRHNDLPAGRCEFYLATNAGAIQETPDQDGLAHFLEHMCFNGLKNLPGKQMLEYLQHIGAEFGRNINASTGVEHTQYMLNNIPVAREGIIDTCLLVMHDYSHFVLNEAAEIDAERGVILEEKRTRNNAAWRMHEASMPYLYGKDCKYSGCTIIGSEENLKNFKPESLRNFYHTWYRPDMQALIVVGDIDVEQIYSKIVKLFADIPAPESPTVKVMPKVEMNESPVVGIITDPENTSTDVEFIWKLGEPSPKEMAGTVMGYMERIVKILVSGVMGERFSDISAKADAPFLDASLGVMNLCETCEVLAGNVSCENAKVLPATEAFLTEVEKMKRYGFTDDEFGRVKDNIIKGLKNRVDNADKRKNPDFIRPIISNFFNGTPYLTPEMELQVAQALCSQLNAALINSMLPQFFQEDHLVVLYSGVDKPGQVHPTQEQILALVDKVKKSDIQANKVEAVSSDFMEGRSLKSGKVTKAAKGQYGTTVWTLKNGLKVVVLPTEYKKDQVILDLRRDGGLSLIATADLASLDNTIFSVFNSNCGIAQFPGTKVSKMLSGKAVSMNPYFNGASAGISGSCSPDDIETALQLMNLEITAPRADKEEWDNSIGQIRAVLPNMLNTPNYVLRQHLMKTVFNSERSKVTTAQTLDKASLASYDKSYRKILSGIAGATLYIVGNVDTETLRPLVEKYCGSIAKGKKTKVNMKNVVSAQKGSLQDVFNTKMETAKATVLQYWSADVNYSVQKSVDLAAARFILNMIYTATLREEEGGTYGASANTGINFFPRQTAFIEVYFDTNVAQQEKLRSLAIDGLKKLATEGPSEEHLTRAIENAKKNLPEKRITNSYWLSALQKNARCGGDFDAEYEKAIAGISAEGIKSVLSEILAQNNFKEIVMLPE